MQSVNVTKCHIDSFDVTVSRHVIAVLFRLFFIHVLHKLLDIVTVRLVTDIWYLDVYEDECCSLF